MKTLRMMFATGDNKVKTVSFNYSRDDLDASEVEDAMDVVIAQNMVPGAVGLSGADLVDRTVTPLL